MRTTFAIILVNACVYMSTCSQPPNALNLVRQTGVLNVVTRNGPTTFYLGSEGPRGVEYELAQGFADALGVTLNIYSADHFDEIIADVTNWQADIAAAGLTITDERERVVRFTGPYREVRQQVIYRLGHRRPKSADDLIDLHIAVPAGTSFADALVELRETQPELKWEEAASADVDELLLRLVDGDIDATVIDSNEFQIASQFYPELRVAFELPRTDSLAWAFRRDDDDSLYQAAQSWLDSIAASGELAAVDERYYDNENRLDYVGTRRFLRHIETRLPKYREHFEASAAEIGQDWRLLAAIGYQESHWDPKAVSPTGVRGLMMLTRATARQIGIEDRTDPVQSIDGGARYLARVKGKIPERIEDPDRTWFALASYNVGFLHLEDARIITQRRGMNPDDWRDVRESLPLLAQKKWHSTVKRGYARGWEPVRYVANIRSYYDSLVWATSEQYRARHAPKRDETPDTETVSADPTPTL
ncbi:MAG: membrane-bound lytic murein transglycosylase MltF [Gammaproteobacteria bacterium]